MNALPHADRVLIAAVVLVATGFWGLVITFSDAPASWSVVTWTLYIIAWHIPSAFLLGLLFPIRWWIGIIASWGAGVMLLGYFAFASAAALLGGTAVAAYAGRTLATLFTSRRTKEPRHPGSAS